MLLQGMLLQNAIRCPYNYLFMLSWISQLFLQKKCERFTKATITNILFCSLLKVDLDKSKHYQMSSRESFYIDNLKKRRKVNSFRIQSHLKSITDNPSLCFFKTKIRKNNHYFPFIFSK